MSAKLSDILVCPVCKQSLFASLDGRKELVCPICSVAYEIRNGIPVMIRSFARELTDEEKARYRKKASELDPSHR